MTNKTSADVEREVEATRSDIDRTVEALKEKMQPKELFDEATRLMGGASNKVLTTAVEQAKENPIPIALIGAGIAWLALSYAKKRPGGYDDYSARGYYETYEGYDENGDLKTRLKAKVSDAVGSAKEALAGAKARVDGAVHQAKDGLASARSTAAESAGEARGRIAGLTGTAQQRAAEASRQAQARFQETLDSEPLILAALGLAVGVAIGASLPASRAENRLIGPHRDKLVGKGRDIAKTSIDEAKTVAQRAYGQVKEELHRQTGPEGEGATLTDKAKALADAGVRTVRDEVDTRLAH